MIDLLAVQDFQRFEQREQERAQFVLCEGPTRLFTLSNPLRKGFSFHIGHHKIGSPVRVEDPENFDNVWMIKPSQSLRFPHKALQTPLEEIRIFTFDCFGMNRGGVWIPEGEERTRINEAFDRLIAAMRESKTLEKAARLWEARYLFLKATA